MTYLCHEPLPPTPVPSSPASMSIKTLTWEKENESGGLISGGPTSPSGVGTVPL